MTTDDIKRFQTNLQDELEGADLYTQIAAAEPDPMRRDLFLQLAQRFGPGFVMPSTPPRRSNTSWR